MTLVLDTSGLYAAVKPNESRHEACREALGSASPPVILSPFVLAELDYLLLTRAGVDRELAFLKEVARGAYVLPSFGPLDIARAHEISSRFRDLALGVADASVLVLCERYGTTDVLTLDHRHFRAVTVDGRALRLRPERA